MHLRLIIHHQYPGPGHTSGRRSVMMVPGAMSADRFGRGLRASIVPPIASIKPRAGGHFDAARLDWLDLRNMLLVAETVTRAALLRTESRGAHQREDHPGLEAHWAVNQVVTLNAETLNITQRAVPQAQESLA